MAKNKVGNGRSAGSVKSRSQVKNPTWVKRARDSGKFMDQEPDNDKDEPWGVNIVDPLKKPKNVSIEKIRKAMRSYYK
jgi:DMSO/TMAO reductase YedYZ molybdopterin-dependent catalytic subunit